MSALWAPLPPRQADPGADVTRPRLRTVPLRPGRLARIPFLMVLIGIFGVGMTGLLMLNTTLQNQAFEARALHRKATELTHTQTALRGQLDVMATPQELARRAGELGMRPNPYAAFLELPSGKIIGKPTRVNGGEVPGLTIKSPAQLAAERAAKEAKRAAKAAERAAKAKAAKAKRDGTADTVTIQPSQPTQPQGRPAPPATGRPSAGRPSAGQPSTGQPSTGQPSTGQPSTGQGAGE